MKRYEITITPRSAMGTPLKGDTLFGHFCWQAAYQPELIDGGLDAALDVYATEPFAVFSSAVPKLPGDLPRHILKRPDLPMHTIFEKDPKKDRAAYHREMKQQKSKKWMIVDGNAPLRLDRAVFWDDHQLYADVCRKLSETTPKSIDVHGEASLCEWYEQPHNTINRLTGTTGKGAFAPYNVQNLYYLQGTKLSLFILLNEKLTDIDRIIKAVTNIGRFGFGRDASIGLGRFEVDQWRESPQPLPGKSEGVYTLAPCVIESKNLADQCRFTPFTRFGRHGDQLAVSRNPFKAPVIMADEGAVFLPAADAPFTQAYVGNAVTNVSKVQPAAVVQGYAPYLPIKLEKNDEE